MEYTISSKTSPFLLTFFGTKTPTTHDQFNTAILSMSVDKIPMLIDYLAFKFSSVGDIWYQAGVAASVARVIESKARIQGNLKMANVVSDRKMSSYPKDQQRLIDKFTSQLELIVALEKIPKYQIKVPHRFVPLDEQLRLLRLTEAGEGRAFDYKKQTLMLFSQVQNWTWPTIPKPNYYAKALLEDYFASRRGPCENRLPWTQTYILTAGNMESLLTRIGQYNEMLVDRDMSKKIVQALPRLGFTTHVSEMKEPKDLLAYLDINEDAIAYSTEFQPAPYRDVSQYILDKFKEFLEGFGKLKDEEEMKRFELTRNQLRFKPKLEVREFDDQSQFKFKLPRTFATGHFLQRVALKCPLAYWREQHEAHQTQRRGELKMAPDIIGITFNEDGIKNIFKYLVGVTPDELLTVDRIVQFRYLCPDRSRMEMTVVRASSMMSRYLVTKSFEGKLQKFVKDLYQTDMGYKEVAFARGPHSLVFPFWQLLSGHPFTSQDDAIDNALRLTELLSSCYPEEMSNVLAYDTTLKDGIRFINGGDDGAIAIHSNFHFLTQEYFDEYKTVSKGVVYTDTQERFVLVISVKDVPKFLKGELVVPMASAPKDSHGVALEDIDRDSYFLIYGMVPCLVSDDEGSILSAFPLYDPLKILCSAWQPHKEAPLFHQLSDKYIGTPKENQRLSQDEYTSLRIAGINTILGFSTPINSVLRKIYDKGNTGDLKFDKMPRKFEERPAGAENVGIDYRFHSPEEVLAIWAPRLVERLTLDFGDLFLSEHPTEIKQEGEPEAAEVHSSEEEEEVIEEEEEKELSWESFFKPSTTSNRWADVFDESFKKEVFSPVAVTGQVPAVDSTLPLRITAPIPQKPLKVRRNITENEIRKADLDLIMFEWLSKQTRLQSKTWLLTAKNAQVAAAFKLDNPKVVEEFKDLWPSASFTNLAHHLISDQVTIVKPSFIGVSSSSKTIERPQGLNVYALKLPGVHGQSDDVYFETISVEEHEKNPYWVVISDFDTKKRVFESMRVAKLGNHHRKLSKLDWLIFQKSFPQTLEDPILPFELEVILSHKRGSRFSPEFLPMKESQSGKKQQKVKQPPKEKIEKAVRNQAKPKDKRSVAQEERKNEAQQERESDNSNSLIIVANTRGRKVKGGKRRGFGVSERVRDNG
jgi:hypothetical protein